MQSRYEQHFAGRLGPVAKQATELALSMGIQDIERRLHHDLRRIQRRPLALVPGVVLRQPRVAQSENPGDPPDLSLAPLLQPRLAGRAVEKSRRTWLRQHTSVPSSANMRATFI